jgi:hypothetical protein
MRFAMFLVLVLLVRGTMVVAIPWRNIAKYAVASAAMGAVLALLPISSRISTTLIWTAVGGAVYLCVLLLIDREARSLPKQVLGEFRGKKQQDRKNS